MALATWFRRIVAELAEDSAYMMAHVVRVVVYLALEFGLSWIQALPEFHGLAPITEPILRLAIPITVLMFCFHVAFILTLKAWEDIRRREDGQHGWRTAVTVLTVLIAGSGGYMAIDGGSVRKASELAAPAASGSAMAKVAVLDLTKFDERSPTNTVLVCPKWAEEMELQFRVPVEQGYIYVSQIDHREIATIGFQPEGMFSQRVSRAVLTKGAHRLAIYRYKLDDKPLIGQIKNIAFEIEHGN